MSEVFNYGCGHTSDFLETSGQAKLHRVLNKPFNKRKSRESFPREYFRTQDALQRLKHGVSFENNQAPWQSQRSFLYPASTLRSPNFWSLPRLLRIHQLVGQVHTSDEITLARAKLPKTFNLFHQKILETSGTIGSAWNTQIYKVGWFMNEGDRISTEWLSKSCFNSPITETSPGKFLTGLIRN